MAQVASKLFGTEVPANNVIDETIEPAIGGNLPEAEQLRSAIAVTPNQAGPQDQIKEKANAVCLVSNSQCLCHRAVWYFGQQGHRFYSMFETFGMALLFTREEGQK